MRISKRFLLFIVLSLLLISLGIGQGTYYSAISTSSPTFISDLQSRIRSPYNQISYDSYDNTIIPNFESWQYSATQRAVQCIYSGEVYPYTGSFAWGYFSREHTWCQSWMPAASGNQYADQHHLFPCNQNNANGRRSNHPLGKVSTVTFSYLNCKLGTDSTGVTVFEPQDSHKGDSARALLYMSLRYNGVSAMDWTFSHLSTFLVTHSEGPQSVAQLIQWHEQDPPDKWEVDRNTYIQSTQLNRNPFVDHPEYVNYINFWTLGSLSPVYANEPASHLSNLTSGTINGTYIQLTWTDSTGTPSPSGYMFLAYDTNNYFIPEDGITYAEDSDFSDGKGIIHASYAGGANSYTFNGLTPNTKYYFRVYPYNGTGTTINYKIDGTVPSIVTTTIVGSLATEPTNHATGFTISSITTDSIKLVWTNSSGGQLPSGYLLMGNDAGSFADPSDGVTYTDDSVLGDSNSKVNISFSSANTTFTFANLNPNQPYYFRLYPYNGTGSQRNYKTDGVVPSANGTTLPSPALASVLTLDPNLRTSSSATGNGTLVNLGYPVLTNYGLVWDSNTSPTISLLTKTSNGSASTTGSYSGSLTGLSAQTLYYIRGYATNSVGTVYGNEVQFYTLSVEPSTHVSSFSASAISQTQINLSWVTSSDARGYILLQKQGSNPTGVPIDGEFYTVGDSVGDSVVAALISSGTTSSQSITGLSAGTQYNFAIYPYNYDGTNLDTYNYRTTATVPTCLATTQSLIGPAVIVNEFSQGASGAKEWVEILVVQDNFNLQNYKLTDGNGSLSITLSGSGFSSMATGTLIVIYNGGDVDTLITSDLTYTGTTDRNLVISSLNNSGSYAITRTTGWSGTTGAFGNSTNTDGPVLYDSSNAVVFTFPSSAYPGAASYSAYTGNTSSGASTGSNWLVASYTGGTPGQPNGGANTVWINSLTGVPVELSSFEAIEKND